MFQGIFSYKLTGRRGWSSCSLEEVDPALIIGANVRKRLFMIFDRECPYTLTLKYAKPKQSLNLNIGITSDGKMVYTPTVRTDFYQIITKRYQTRDDAQKDIEEINKYQKMLKN